MIDADGKGGAGYMQKLLIVDATEEFRSALADAAKGIYIVRTCGDGEEALELAATFAPDILVLDLTVSGMDGLSLAQILSQGPVKPVILATTRFTSPYVLDAAGRTGIDYMMVKPCNIRAVLARLEDLVSCREPKVRARPDPKVSVSNLLLALGIHTNNKGYIYLREAIPLYAKDPQQSVTKELYPLVGKLCGGSVEQVERAMRTAIQRAWNQRDEQIWKMYFVTLADGFVKRPSNSEFISRLAELLIGRYREEV